MAKLPEGKVEGRSLTDKLFKLEKPKRHDEFFGVSKTPLLRLASVNIEPLSNNEFMDLVAHAHVRRGLDDRFLKDLGKKIREMKHDIELQDKANQQKTDDIVAFQKTPQYRFRLLANQSPSTRISALREWSLEDLRITYSKIVKDGKIPNVLPHMFDRAKQDLLSVIEQKTMLEE